MSKLICGCCCCFMILLAFAGCGESDEIQVQQIPRNQSNLGRFDKEFAPSRTSTSDATPQGKSRMVVAMVMRPEATWTFKILGPDKDVAELKAGWESFFSKLEFSSAGEPKFEIPDGWVDGGIRKGMFSTIQTLLLTSNSPPTKMEISSLSAGQRLPDNVNRWRGQLGLAPISGEVTLPKFSFAGGEYYLFNEAGVFAGRRPPFAGGAGGSSAVSPHGSSGGAVQASPQDSAAPKSREVDFVAPDGWDTGKQSSIVKVRLQRKTDEGAAEISLARMGSENEWGLNASVWAGQAGLAELTDAEIQERTTELTVADVWAKRVRFIEDDDAQERAIVGIMFKKSGSAWFVKLSGDKAAVIEAENDFNQFVESLKIVD